MIRSIVTGTGSALPTRRVSNEELAQEVDTSDEWIVERTGIRNRYIAGDGETIAVDRNVGDLRRRGDALQLDFCAGGDRRFDHFAAHEIVDRRRTGDHIDHARRETGLVHDPHQFDDRQRVLRCRPHDDGVAHRQRRSDLPAGDHQREIPVDDQRAHAQRLAEGHHRAVGIAGDGLPVNLVDRARIVFKRVRHRADFAPCRADRLTAVAGFDLRQHLGVF